MIRKTATGFQVDISNGRTKRHRKSFKTRAEAQRYERHFLNEMDDGKPWTGSKKDNRKLSELIEIWYKLHGQNLKDGFNRKTLLLIIDRDLKNPIAEELTAKEFSHYRADQLKKFKPKTLNNWHGYISSVYNELKRLNEINYANPLADLRKIKIRERGLSCLNDNEIEKLLKELKPFKDTYHCALICLACGTRWGEARALQPESIKDGKISIIGKNGKARYIPIKKELIEKLELPLSASKNTFANCYKKSGIKKTQGQSTHILRHTFASHFIMNGGNVLSLQKVLDHSTLTMTMRYAHLAPDHLKDVLKFAPVVKM